MLIKTLKTISSSNKLVCLLVCYLCLLSCFVYLLILFTYLFCLLIGRMAVDGRAGGRVQGGLHALRQGQILSELILQGQILSGLILLINKDFKTSFKRLCQILWRLISFINKDLTHHIEWQSQILLVLICLMWSL